MIKLSPDLSLLRNKKADDKKGTDSILSNKEFAQGITCFSLIAKLFLIPLCFVIPPEWSPLRSFHRGMDPWDIDSRLYQCYFLLAGLHVYHVMIKFQKTKKVHQKFSLSGLLLDLPIYVHLLNLCIFYHIPPSNLAREQVILELLVVIIDTMFLYVYYVDYFSMKDYESAEKMKLHECFEENHGIKKLTILESTNTCITMKNVGYEDLDVDFSIDRQTYDHTEYCEEEDPYDDDESEDEESSDEEFEEDYEFIHSCYAKGCKIPPGKVFKIVTIEYYASDVKEDELCFIIPEYRVFGRNTDNYVITTVDFDKDATSSFDVRLTQKYETKKQRKMREKHEKSLPAVVYRDIPKKMKKVKKTIKNDKEE